MICIYAYIYTEIRTSNALSSISRQVTQLQVPPASQCQEKRTDTSGSQWLKRFGSYGALSVELKSWRLRGGQFGAARSSGDALRQDALGSDARLMYMVSWSRLDSLTQVQGESQSKPG